MFVSKIWNLSKQVYELPTCPATESHISTHLGIGRAAAKPNLTHLNGKTVVFRPDPDVTPAIARRSTARRAIAIPADVIAFLMNSKCILQKIVIFYNAE